MPISSPMTSPSASLGRRPVDGLGSPADGLAVQGADLRARTGQRGQLAVLEEDDVARMGEERRDVAGAEGLVLAEAEDQRAVGLGHDDLVRRVRSEDGDRVGAVHPDQGSADGVDQTGRPGAQRLVHQMGDDLGVGVAGEAHSAGLELAPQRHVVLDDPVVDDGDLAGHVRVRVGLARAAVRRPSGVTDSGGPGQRVLLERGLEVDQLSQRAHDLDASAVAGRAGVERQAGGVVPAIFEPAQAVDQDGSALFRSDVADDTAHDEISSVAEEETEFGFPRYRSAI
jgi:hypothetical protein